MGTYSYTVTGIDPEGLEKYSEKDLEVVNTYVLNSSFIPLEHRVELHIYSLESELLYSDTNYTNYSFLQNSETAGRVGANEITLDPIRDIISAGFANGGVKTVYNFVDNLYSETKTGSEFYIEEISNDRKEIRLLTNQITNSDVEKYTEVLIEKLQSTSYFSDFKLNFGKNDLVLGVNIKLQDFRGFNSLIVKLYEPLPSSYGVKDLLTIEDKVSNSVGYEIDAEVVVDEIKIPYLKGPNFNLDQLEGTVNASEYLNYNELFSYSTINSYRELNSLFNEKSVNISIDYSDYSEFTQFSSVNERLRNFKYKLDLIEAYEHYINTTGSLNTDNKYYEGLINEIVGNFDHYDRHLYYESGSTSWPKSNTTRPYVNSTGSVTGSWYNQELIATELFDNNNPNQLINTVPEYLREDPQNAPYSVFLSMIGQHFDNLWIYSKAVTDKYDNDNRLDKGISKELVQDVLKNFGVKLYTSNKSTSDLFRTFTGQLFDTGSENITTLISASIQPTSEENYRNEVYKRIYHNLPLLLKAKGTERGIKALISSFGIPTDNSILGSDSTHYGLKARVYGGSKRLSDKFTGPLSNTTSSLDRISVDDTGSIVGGNTLSKDVSIVKRDDTLVPGQHSIDIGFSPTDNLEEELDTILPVGFSIDDLIGDPSLAFSSSYEPLVSSSNFYINQVMVSGSHDLQDFTRILKFYDNVVFKMVKDLLPARSSISSGIIIKPHVLERNKIKQVQGTFNTDILEVSMSIGSYTGSDAGSYNGSIDKVTSYTDTYMTSGGIAIKDEHEREQAKYNGELSGSQITISQTDLDPVNPFKYQYSTEVQYKINIVSQSAEPTPTPTPTATATPTPTSTPIDTTTPTPTPTRSGTPTPTPTHTVACTSYNVTNDGCSPQAGANQVSYIRCGKSSTTYLTVPCGDSITLCGTNFNFGSDLTESSNGGCTQ